MTFRRHDVDTTSTCRDAAYTFAPVSPVPRPLAAPLPDAAALPPRRRGEVSMSTRRVHHALLLAAMAAATGSLVASVGVAQTQPPGSVTGRVTDAASGQPIMAAQVHVVGTNIGTQTNTEGQYTLRGVSPGPTEVRVLRVGFAEQKQRVTVVSGQAATANFQMRAVATTLTPVVTTATGSSDAWRSGTPSRR
jgi:hypothetical protein